MSMIVRRTRQTILASVAAGALTACLAHPAHADLPVIDIASFEQLVQQAATEGQQLAQLAQVVSTGKGSLLELQTLYSSLSHMTSVVQLAPTLLDENTIQALPQMVQVEGMLNGQGFTGTLAAQAQAMLSRMQTYRPTGTDPTAVQMNTAAQASAGQMVTAETIYNAQTTRLNGSQDLMASLGQSGDAKETADLQARATIENGYATAQGTQIQAVAVMQRAQEDAQREQQDQAWRQGSDSLLQQAQAAEAAAPGS